MCPVASPCLTSLPARFFRYSQGFRKLPQDTKPFSKTGGGYWFGQRKVGHSYYSSGLAGSSLVLIPIEVYRKST